MKHVLLASTMSLHNAVNESVFSVSKISYKLCRNIVARCHTISQNVCTHSGPCGNVGGDSSKSQVCLCPAPQTAFDSRIVNKRKLPRILGQNKHPVSLAIPRNNQRNSNTCIYLYKSLRPVTHTHTPTRRLFTWWRSFGWDIAAKLYHSTTNYTTSYWFVSVSGHIMSSSKTNMRLSACNLFLWSEGYTDSQYSRQTHVTLYAMWVHSSKLTNGSFFSPTACNDLKCERSTR